MTCLKCRGNVVADNTLYTITQYCIQCGTYYDKDGVSFRREPTELEISGRGTDKWSPKCSKANAESVMEKQRARIRDNQLKKKAQK